MHNGDKVNNVITADPDGQTPFCAQFSESPDLREVVFGTSQLCLDLCSVLKLPSQVAATSLFCLESFFCEFDFYDLELPLLCGACILVTWKYWEDFLPIKSSRKLLDICRELFRLLVLQDTSDDDNDDNNEPSYFMKHHEDNNSMTTCHDHVIQKKDSIKFLSNKTLSITDWTLRDEGKEFHRLREKIKLYESCLLRCLNYEVGPFELPFERIEYLCRNIWTQQSMHLSHDINNNNSSQSNNVSSLSPLNVKETNESSFFLDKKNINLLKQTTPTTSLLPLSSCNINDASSNDHNNINCSGDTINNKPTTLLNNTPNDYCFTIHSTQLLLHQFLYLSYGFALDFYRAPFCLLFSSNTIAVASVWKASIALQFTWPFKEAIEVLLNNHSPIVNWGNEVFPISLHNLHQILKQFQLLYKWLTEFQSQYEMPKEEHFEKVRKRLFKNI